MPPSRTSVSGGAPSWRLLLPHVLGPLPLRQLPWPKMSRVTRIGSEHRGRLAAALAQTYVSLRARVGGRLRMRFAWDARVRRLGGLASPPLLPRTTRGEIGIPPSWLLCQPSSQAAAASGRPRGSGVSALRCLLAPQNRTRQTHFQGDFDQPSARFEQMGSLRATLIWRCSADFGSDSTKVGQAWAKLGQARSNCWVLNQI